jgi:hypothetical protein
MRKRLNWRIISYNLAEAREQIEQIESRIKSGKKPSEVELQIMLEHAYHHLNFAWNIRHEKTESYRHLTDENFNRWSKFPKEMKSSKI